MLTQVDHGARPCRRRDQHGRTGQRHHHGRARAHARDRHAAHAIGARARDVRRIFGIEGIAVALIGWLARSGRRLPDGARHDRADRVDVSASTCAFVFPAVNLAITLVRNRRARAAGDARARAARGPLQARRGAALCLTPSTSRRAARPRPAVPPFTRPRRPAGRPHDSRPGASRRSCSASRWPPPPCGCSTTRSGTASPAPPWATTSRAGWCRSRSPRCSPLAYPRLRAGRPRGSPRSRPVR